MQILPNSSLDCSCISCQRCKGTLRRVGYVVGFPQWIRRIKSTRQVRTNWDFILQKTHDGSDLSKRTLKVTVGEAAEKPFLQSY